MAFSRSNGLFALLIGAAVELWPGAVAAEDPTDFAPESPAWNGLADLQALAQARDVRWSAPDTFDVESLGASDGLLVIDPVDAPSGALLARFLRKGGRVALADDFGAASTALASFGIQRGAQPGVERELWVRGNRNLLVARARSSHPLTRGVAGLVTNHPSVLTHPSLAPIFSVGDSASSGALVLSGAVGEGRLVALGDPSVLINNMLAYPDNQRFAQNLIDYLTQSAKGQLVVVTPATRWLRGQGARDDGSILAGLRQGLLRMSEADLPKSALLLIALGLASLLLLVAATALPRASAYGQPPFLQPTAIAAGVAGRVAFHLAQRQDLARPLHVFRHELEARLVDAAGLTGQPTRVQVLERLRSGGASKAELTAISELLSELDVLRGTPGVGRRAQLSARRFHDLIESGKSILGALEARELR